LAFIQQTAGFIVYKSRTAFTFLEGVTSSLLKTTKRLVGFKV